MADILVRRDGGIGTLVFSNLEKHNAMTADMWEALPSRIAELDRDPEVRVIVLSGDGDKAFVSGADVSQFGANRSEPAAQRRYNEMVEAAYASPARATKPVLAQIRGICFGGGLGLAAEQGRAHDRQHGVLVGRRRDRAAQGNAAVNDEMAHSKTPSRSVD